MENIAVSESKIIPLDKINSILDGEPSRELRRLISLSSRRTAGAFFTNSTLARKVVKLALSEQQTFKRVLDPTCGVGDLLIAYAREMPIKKDICSTINNWKDVLSGYDIHKEFINVAKARLVLSAIERGSIINLSRALEAIECLNQFRVGNSLNDNDAYSDADLILANPPYSFMKSPEECSWATGKVTSAAVFLSNMIRYAEPNTKIIAILPEVLRTGQRYQKWRESIIECAEVNKVDVVGQFDRWTDIDVFVLGLTKKAKSTKQSKTWWIDSNKYSDKVGEDFDVHVGPVVPHRDPKRGNSVSYLISKNLPHWKIVHRISEKRKCKVNLFSPPFVVVRRTSRPGDKNRAIGTIVSGQRQVAIENHLIVLIPKDGTLKRCQSLITNLRDIKTNQWFNKRIRCRHLTVSSLSELPWWKDRS